jgi:hypothetical protein
MLGVSKVGEGFIGVTEGVGTGFSLVLAVADWYTAYAPKASATAITMSNAARTLTTAFSCKLSAPGAAAFWFGG